jgi:hypothetical protein
MTPASVWLTVSLHPVCESVTRCTTCGVAQRHLQDAAWPNMWMKIQFHPSSHLEVELRVKRCMPPHCHFNLDRFSVAEHGCGRDNDHNACHNLETAAPQAAIRAGVDRWTGEICAIRDKLLVPGVQSSRVGRDWPCKLTRVEWKDFFCLVPDQHAEPTDIPTDN